MRLFPKMVTQRDANAGTDTVIAAWPVPGNCRVNGFWLELSVMTTLAMDLTDNLMYGVTAYVVPVPDPDSAISPDTLWDRMIPKDTAVGSGVLDLDTSVADGTPEFELGELDMTDFIEVSTAPVELFTRRKLITFASAPIGFHLDPITPFTDMFYVPTDYIKTRVRKGALVKYPSYLLVGLSQPDYAATKTTYPALEDKGEWAMIQYFQESLREMWKHILGLVGSGTQEMAVEAATLIEEYFEHFHEETANRWGGLPQRGLSAVAKVTLDLTVPGEFGQMQVGGAL